MADRPAPFRLAVHLQPRAPHSRIVGRWREAIKVQVKAAPVDGAANAALIELLAQVLGVPRRAVRIVHGESSRNKVVEIAGVDAGAGERRLQEVLGRDACVDKPRSRD